MPHKRYGISQPGNTGSSSSATGQEILYQGEAISSSVVDSLASSDLSSLHVADQGSVVNPVEPVLPTLGAAQ